MKKIFQKIPCEIRYLIGNFLILFVFFLLFRFIFYLAFIQPAVHDTPDVATAGYLGIKFDLRLALILTLPIWLLLLIWKGKVFARTVFRKIILTYFFIVELVLLLVYVTDLGFYGYLNRRLDVFIFHFLNLQDAGTNMQMVWESYPVVWGFIGMVALMFVLCLLHRKLYQKFAIQKAKRLSVQLPTKRKRRTLIIEMIVLFILMAGGIYGNFDYYPLRWSQAMFTGDNRITNLALNPVLNLINSIKFRNETVDIAATKKYYPYMAKYLGIQQPDSTTLNFTRYYPGDSTSAKPNIVFVMLESTGAAVSSMYGNPLQPTPYMKQLADSGVLFENFYVPAHSTARTVFGLTTGLPDITTTETASRHKKIIDQRVIMNEFKGYEKYYLLGGNMNWANIRALFTNNVDGVKLYEESDFKQKKKLDVWGISDYDLVHEADKVFKNAYDRKQPFVAFLQLADNHRPYSTTPGAGDFKRWTEKDIDPAKMKASGFISIDQLNALRYEDYNVGKLIELAKSSGYMKNTIFVFFGDHNCTLNAYDFMPLPEYEMGTWEVHVTAFIYGPSYFKPQRVATPANLIDLYPTMAHVAGIPFYNYTLGINIFDTTRPHYSFIGYWSNGKFFYGLMGKDYLYAMSKDKTTNNLFDLRLDPLKDVKANFPDTVGYLANLDHGFFESTWYLFFNNKKEERK